MNVAKVQSFLKAFRPIHILKCASAAGLRAFTVEYKFHLSKHHRDARTVKHAEEWCRMRDEYARMIQQITRENIMLKHRLGDLKGTAFAPDEPD